MNLARQLADTDPDTAKEILEQIGHELQDAVQELRNLAHGIYPPLLMDRGLPRSAQRRRQPRRTAHRTRRRRHRSLLRRDRSGRLLLLPRSAPERGEARRRGIRGEDLRARGGRCAALRRLRRRRRLRPLLGRAARPRLREHERPGRRDRRQHRGGVGPRRGHQDHRSDSARPVPETRPSATPCCVGPRRLGRARDRIPPCGRTQPLRSHRRRRADRRPGTWRAASPPPWDARW